MLKDIQIRDTLDPMKVVHVGLSYKRAVVLCFEVGSKIVVKLFDVRYNNGISCFILMHDPVKAVITFRQLKNPVKLKRTESHAESYRSAISVAPHFGVACNAPYPFMH